MRFMAAPLDGWSLGHLAVGYVLGLAGLQPLHALALFAGFEVVEPSLKRLANRPSVESRQNQVADVTVAMVGHAVGRRSLLGRTR